MQLQTLSLDEFNTWIKGVGSSITAAGLSTFRFCRPGQYRIGITTATAVYAALTKIVED